MRRASSTAPVAVGAATLGVVVIGAVAGAVMASWGSRAMTPTISAHLDPRLSARIVSCEPLHYESGGSEALDRSPHVRAASGIVRVGEALVIVQDDTSFLAVRTGGAVDAIPLPPGPGGRRRFEERRGNKLDKLDLEAATLLSLDGVPTVLALGSGSLSVRERFVLLDVGSRRARVFDASPLYARLRADAGFAGSELNVEGATVVDGVLRLFQRGNGAPREGLEPVNATCDIEVGALTAWLTGRGPVPEPRAVRRYELGREDGVAYGFTDATVVEGRVLVAAGAEASADVVRDGEVLGARIGILDGEGVRLAPLLEADGRPSVAKIEGLAPSDDPRRLYAVTDLDDPDTASLLCTLALEGPWF